MSDSVDRALILGNKLLSGFDTLKFYSLYPDVAGNVAAAKSVYTLAVDFVAAARLVGLEEVDDLLSRIDVTYDGESPDKSWQTITELSPVIEYLEILKGTLENQDDALLPLNQNEWDVYHIIIRHNIAGKRISRNVLLNELSEGREDGYSENTLKDNIKNLRLKRDIRNVSGKGYFEPKVLREDQ